jgi:hypothetical protein
VYLDTAILVKLVVPQSDSPYYADLVEGQIVWSSQLVMTDCFSARPAILRLSVNGGETAEDRPPPSPKLALPAHVHDRPQALGMGDHQRLGAHAGSSGSRGARESFLQNAACPAPGNVDHLITR